MVTQQRAEAFFRHGRIAFVGLSASESDFSRYVAAAMARHGMEIVPVNPHAGLIGGQQCYATVANMPDPPKAALLMVPRGAALKVVRECIAAGVQTVWFHHGLGGEGSASPEAVDLAVKAGLDVVSDACPLMFLEPTEGFVHDAHRALRFGLGDEPGRPISRAAVGLSLAAIGGGAIASAATLAWSGAFPQPANTAFNDALAEARGWSAVTLLLAVPIAMLALARARHGSLRGRLAWAGAMAYLLYTYLEMAVSPPFTALYLVYVATYACAIPALVLAVSSVDVGALPAAFGDRAPRRAMAVFGFGFAAVLAAAWLKGILAQTVGGEFGWPQGYDAIGHVVHALDLGLQVPLGIAAGVLLLRREPAGYLVGAIMLVMAVCMAPALTAMVGVAGVVSGVGAGPAAPFAALSLVALGLAVVYARSLHPIRTA